MFTLALAGAFLLGVVVGVVGLVFWLLRGDLF